MRKSVHTLLAAALLLSGLSGQVFAGGLEPSPVHFHAEVRLSGQENPPAHAQAGPGRRADAVTLAAGAIRGVGTMGYGTSAPAAPPRPSYGGAPGDYGRGYEGPSPTPGDPWHRESDFRARDYMLRHGPQPLQAAPPGGSAAPYSPADPQYPTLPKPPLPGDRDMPSDRPEVQ